MSFKILPVLLLLTVLAGSAEQTIDKDAPWICVRWQWTGDVYNRTVYCLEWKKKDCSNRLYKDICKLGV
jgi:hypothetical protein